MSTPSLKVIGLKKWFPIRTGFMAALREKEQQYVKAVDGISFEILSTEVFGLAGESGCGKTTTGRAILRLIEPTAGKIYLEDIDVTSLSSRQLKSHRQKMQIIFQDPYDALNPRLTIYNLVAEPLRIQKLIKDPKDEEELVFQALEEVDLNPSEFTAKYPHELSGGQRQRVAIARVFALKPRFIVADEPVSMLDVSIRTGVLKLMLEEKERTGSSMLFITHDLSLARYICSRIGIMYLGAIVELGKTGKLLHDPKHPYTQALIEAVPVPDPSHQRGKIPIKGEVSSLPEKGCRFYPRCPYVMDICKETEPQLFDFEERLVACYLYAKDGKK